MREIPYCGVLAVAATRLVISKCVVRLIGSAVVSGGEGGRLVVAKAVGQVAAGRVVLAGGRASCFSVRVQREATGLPSGGGA